MPAIAKAAPTVSPRTYASFHTPTFTKYNLGQRIHTFLTDRDSRALCCVDTAFYSARRDIHTALIRHFKNTDNDEVITLQWGPKKESVRIVKVLGEGGSKTVYLLSSGQALIMPNLLNAVAIAKIWSRMVAEEVAMHAKISALGLLSPHAVPVTVSFSGKLGSLPAYLSETFEAAKNKEMFVIEANNSNSTWKMDTHFLLPKQDRLQEASWDFIMRPFLSDVAMVVVNHIPLDSDSLNYAVIAKPASRFALRYYLFDFSSKRGALKISKNLMTPVQQSKEARGYILAALHHLFYREFGYGYDDPKESPAMQLKYRLVDQYTDEVMQLIRPDLPSAKK